MAKEAAYFRAYEFERGEILFTDSTNAERLYRKHSENIRYIITITALAVLEKMARLERLPLGS